MATLPIQSEFPHDAGLKCPVCDEDIPVVAIVEIEGGSTRHAGSAGFNKPIVTVNLNSKVVGFRIRHECDYKNPEEY